MTKNTDCAGPASSQEEVLDAIIIGAGFAGLYMLHRLRDVMGLSVTALEAASGVGGTWYWNRYPGARCDTASHLYCYSFSRELYEDWTWQSKYPDQPQLLAYLEHVADRFKLRSHIQFDTRVTAATYDQDRSLWRITTANGDGLLARYLITAVGLLSAATYVPDLPGLDSFEGPVLHTARWPHDVISLADRRVGIVGTGSSGVQAIPVIAKDAEHLVVFQRTAQYTLPAQHDAWDTTEVARAKADFDAFWHAARWADNGLPVPHNGRKAVDATAADRESTFEALWAAGGFGFVFSSYQDMLTDRRANDFAAEFIRARIRAIVRDPCVAETLLPVDHPLGSKRPIVDTTYHETFNRDNVTLVDLRQTPLVRATGRSLETSQMSYELDTIVFATGFDAVIGPLLKIDIRGRGGASLKEHWASGASSYLGLGIAGFPNLFTITGPGSASGTNLVLTIEHHIEWITNCIAHLEDIGHPTIEPSEEAETGWMQFIEDSADRTLIPLADSWFTGSNIPGKPARFLIYVGPFGEYRRRCDEVAARGYAGFIINGDDASRSARSCALPSGSATRLPSTTN